MDNPFDQMVIDSMMVQPGIQRVPSPKLTLFVKRGFLSADECGAIIERIDRNRRPSTLANYNGDAGFRTSETCDLDGNDAVVRALDDKIAAFTRLDLDYGEPMQGQRYETGQEFKAHTDYFEPQGVDYEKYTSVAGQRTWTVMIYLNDVGAGGATRFKAIDKMVQPEAGKLLAWNNRRPDGSPNPSTIHHAMKVRAGQKYVVTKWFRERPWGWV
jgi:prolyl 4-hydroxylase